MPINNPRRGSHPYYHYHHRHYSQSKKRTPWLLLLLPIVLIGYCAYWYAQPLDPVSSTTKVLSVKSQPAAVITWPATSQAAIGSIDQGVLAIKPDQVVRPTASTAKLITALTVLQEKPLNPGEQGPTITMTQKDVDIHNQYFANDGSVTKVEVGTKLSQYQMLQGLLLPSANNYADSLAIWAFGSLENYQKAAQKLVDKIGMQKTTIGTDASGFSPSTTSNTEDLTKLAIASVDNKVVAEIVQQPEVNLPVAGIKQNTNWLLGADGVIGLKTGNTNEAGGVYVFASKYDYDAAHSTTIVGAVQGESNVIAAIRQSRLLINQAKSNYKLVKIIEKGQTVAVYSSQWGQQVNAVAAKDVTALQWGSSKIKPQIHLDQINAPASKGAKVGTIKVGDISTDIILQNDLNTPDWQWRVFRWL